MSSVDTTDQVLYLNAPDDGVVRPDHRTEVKIGETGYHAYSFSGKGSFGRNFRRARQLLREQSKQRRAGITERTLAAHTGERIEYNGAGGAFKWNTDLFVFQPVTVTAKEGETLDRMTHGVLQSTADLRATPIATTLARVTALNFGNPLDSRVEHVSRSKWLRSTRYKGGVLGLGGFIQNVRSVGALQRGLKQDEARLAVLETITESQRLPNGQYNISTPEALERSNLSWAKMAKRDRLDVIPLACKVANVLGL